MGGELPGWQMNDGTVAEQGLDLRATVGRCYTVVMTTLRVHFDGRVLVPDEPVDLPQGRTLEVDVHDGPSPGAKVIFVEMRNGFPVIQCPPGAKMITLEDVKRLMEDEI